jgi:hypothetical protein
MSKAMQAAKFEALWNEKKLLAWSLGDEVAAARAKQNELTWAARKAEALKGEDE